MRNLLRLIPFTRRYLRLMIAAWASVFVSGALVQFSPQLIRFALSQGLRPVYDASGAFVRLDGNSHLLIYSALAIIVFALGRGLTQFGQTYLGESIGQKVSYDIRNTVYDHIQRMSYAFHDRIETGQ